MQYPNSKYAPETSQILRNIDEVLGSHEFGVGHFYFDKGANPAAANRLGYAADQYPLFSQGGRGTLRNRSIVPQHGARFRARPALPLRASFAIIR